jgi:UDP-glucose 4-epimerase
MKYLVTGSAGFVGSHVVDALLNLGHEVVGIDNFATGRLNFLSYAIPNNRFTLVKGDILNLNELNNAMRDVNGVFHLAANADIRGGLDDPRKDVEQNILATFNVLESMRINNVSRIVFASSAAALGEPLIFPTPESCAIPKQTSIYGASKMSCEGLVSAYCEGYGFVGRSFRFVSLLGPRYQHGHVFDFVKQLVVNSQRLDVIGNGEAKKSYLHINDCISAMMLTSENMINLNEGYEVYHLGIEDYCAVKQSANWICEALQVNPKIYFGSGVRGWVGDNPFVFLDVSLIKKLGWNPKFDLKASIQETAIWLSKNQWIFGLRQ